jgi:hypothetical protein
MAEFIDRWKRKKSEKENRQGGVMKFFKEKSEITDLGTMFKMLWNTHTVIHAWLVGKARRKGDEVTNTNIERFCVCIGL